MRVHRAFKRWVSGGLVMLLLFMQLATAAYACPAELQALRAEASMAAMPGCDGNMPRRAWTPSSRNCARPIANKASRSSAPARPCDWTALAAAVGGHRLAARGAQPICRTREPHARARRRAPCRRAHHRSTCPCSSCATSVARGPAAVAAAGRGRRSRTLALAMKDATWTSPLHLRSCAAAWLLLGLPLAASAGLSFDEATRLAREQAPALQAQRSTLDGAQAVLPAAATLPDPRLIVGRGQPAGQRRRPLQPDRATS